MTDMWYSDMLNSTDIWYNQLQTRFLGIHRMLTETTEFLGIHRKLTETCSGASRMSTAMLYAAG
eukprot:SAG31_NODE_3027_length_4770_cov_2.108114_2_plen_64_part_00